MMRKTIIPSSFNNGKGRVKVMAEYRQEIPDKPEKKT
jgi:hypothetical protein